MIFDRILFYDLEFLNWDLAEGMYFWIKLSFIIERNKLCFLILKLHINWESQRNIFEQNNIWTYWGFLYFGETRKPKKMIPKIGKKNQILGKIKTFWNNLIHILLWLFNKCKKWFSKREKKLKGKRFVSITKENGHFQTKIYPTQQRNLNFDEQPRFLLSKNKKVLTSNYKKMTLIGQSLNYWLPKRNNHPKLDFYKPLTSLLCNTVNLRIR